jgi:hypothetical protein
MKLEGMEKWRNMIKITLMIMACALQVTVGFVFGALQFKQILFSSVIHLLKQLLLATFEYFYNHIKNIFPWFLT